ncbi:MAG TPA: DUF6340 family protein [Flavobacteriales bacterium]|nr:DUF6340 family protein [Flavobacteriales bacterium]
MKNLTSLTPGKLVLVSTCLFHLASCKLYTDVQVQKPVDISAEDVRGVQNVLIVNRTAVPKGSKTENVFEGIFTGETPGGDKNAARECIRGLQESLSKALNYKSTSVVPVVYYGSAGGNIPAPLSWKTVDSLCAANNADMLVVLEYFDSNAGISRSITNPGVPPVNSANTNNVSIKTVWRTYKASTRTIIDDFTGNSNAGYNNWRSPYFIQNRSERYNNTMSGGYWAGIDYGFRISEQWVLEGRRYFKGGNGTLRYASKLARFGQWDEANAIWEEQAKSMSPKVRARALHNMAVYAERKGDLNTALTHARTSFGIKGYHDTGILLNSVERQLRDKGKLLTAGTK